MKTIFTLIITAIALSCFGQEKVSHTGLNQAIPNNIELGVKSNVNFYFAKHKIVSDGADEAGVEVTEKPGFGFGVYGHLMFTDHVGLQAEVYMNYRRGLALSYRDYDIDTARTLKVQELSNYSTFWFEIPVYLKFHWELAHDYQGNWKTKSQLGVYVGPRLLLTPNSNRKFSRATTTRIYDEISLSVENDIEAPSEYSSAVGVGAAIGVDYELWNGFAFHIAYFRGFSSHVNKINGFKALDNRIEVGIGYRFN